MVPQGRSCVRWPWSRVWALCDASALASGPFTGPYWHEDGESGVSVWWVCVSCSGIPAWQGVWSRVSAQCARRVSGAVLSAGVVATHTDAIPRLPGLASLGRVPPPSSRAHPLRAAKETAVLTAARTQRAQRLSAGGLETWGGGGGRGPACSPESDLASSVNSVYK